MVGNNDFPCILQMLNFSLLASAQKWISHPIHYHRIRKRICPCSIGVIGSLFWGVLKNLGLGGFQDGVLLICTLNQSCGFEPPDWNQILSGWRLWTIGISYCGLLKSCTTKDDDYPIVNRVLTIPGGAGFLPSTIGLGRWFQWIFFVIFPPKNLGERFLIVKHACVSKQDKLTWQWKSTFFR